MARSGPEMLSIALPVRAASSSHENSSRDSALRSCRRSSRTFMRDRCSSAFSGERRSRTSHRVNCLTPEQIAGKTNRMPRRAVPIACNHLTMFIDVQANLLFFVVAAWEDDFTGYVVDYGTYPDQKRAYFTLRDARRTLAAGAPRRAGWRARSTPAWSS